MSRMIIEGGNPLDGEITINGAKNATLPIMAASVLTPLECQIKNVPDIRDTRVMSEILQQLGGKIDRASDEQTVSLFMNELVTDNIDKDLMQKMRSSVLLTGPLLVRLGSARMTYPGGCAIGSRPVDMHLAGFEQMGAQVRADNGLIDIKVPGGGLIGAEIHLKYPSVGATENIMMAACGARGITRIYNPAREPEIRSLAEFLKTIGADINGAGGDVITIEGTSELGGAEYCLIPDRIEAGTFAMAAAITRGQVVLREVAPEHLGAFTAKLKKAEIDVNLLEPNVMQIVGSSRPRATNITTYPYPGYPTDLQNQFLALACTSAGTNRITETVFENRFKVVREFRKMGAKVDIQGRTAVVEGVSRLQGTTVRANQDLRGAVSLVLAGLGAEGTTIVENVDPVDRGYANLTERLQQLGAEVVRETVEDD